jgi:preprotein translocase subunit SecB
VKDLSVENPNAPESYQWTERRISRSNSTSARAASRRTSMRSN